MPITKSAKKALRQSERRRVRNLIKREAYKNALKEAYSLAGQKSGKELQEAIRLAYKALDKAAKTNVISKQTASRKKSRLMKFIRKQAATKL